MVGVRVAAPQQPGLECFALRIQERNMELEKLPLQLRVMCCNEYGLSVEPELEISGSRRKRVSLHSSNGVAMNAWIAGA